MSDNLKIIYSLPVLLILSAVSLILLRKRNAHSLYTDGVSTGLTALKELVSPMLMLCISVKLISACGICDGIANLASRAGITSFVSEELLPLIITRPISGSAANASLAQLIEVCGADSFEAFCAAVIMSSGDTCLYIHSMYFSVQTPKKTGITLLLMLLVSLFSVCVCIFICKMRFFG